ncbi:MAG: hypothetical protein IJY01_04240 [Clostridia bacterium]|nr:hypothetical protein [Clostridia bacterium]
MKRACTRAVCVFLLVTAISFSLCLTALGGYDCSDVGSPLSRTLSPSDIAELYLSDAGAFLFCGEGDFIDKYSDLSLTVSTAVPTDRVKITYDEASGVLSVLCDKYTYTARDAENREITWYPVRVNFLGKDYPVTSSAEPVAVSGITPEEAGEGVTVTYRLDCVISREDIDTLINLYYDTAKYSYEMGEYTSLSAAYAEYLDELRLYLDRDALYSSYLSELARYEDELYRYESYETLKEKYDNELLLYLDYLQRYGEYERQYAEYLSYKDTVDRIEGQLLPLELTKEKMRDGRDLYTVIFGKTVDSVIDSKALITSSIVGVEPWVVDLAAEATARVRAHLTNYFGKQSPEEKYEYYRESYTSLCKDFRDLTASLDKLYSNPRVRGILIAEGKARKYCILLAQLALVTDALTDGVVYNLDGVASYDENYTLENTKRDDILGAVYLTDTDTATPIESGIPPYCAAPLAPEAVAEPIPPARIPRPTPPTEPALPGPIPRPIAEPTAPSATGSIAVIYEALSLDERAEHAELFASGGITRRSGADLTVTLYTEVWDSLSSPRMNITFTDGGGTELYSATVRQGSACVYQGSIPERAPDSLFAYEFSGWQRASGERVELDAITEDTLLQPSFEAVPRIYAVTWHLADLTLVTYHEAGSLPTPPKVSPPPDEGSLMLVLTGYDREITPVTSDTSYTACYDKRYIVPTASGGAEITVSEGNCSLDLFGHSDRSFYIGDLLERIAGRYSLSVYTEDTELLFSYTEVLKMKEAGVKYISPETVKQGEGAYLYRTGLFDADRVAVKAPILASASLPAVLASYEGVGLYTETDGRRVQTSFELAQARCKFRMKANVSYTLALEYAVSVYCAQGAGISDIPAIVRPGERVLISAFAKEGYTSSVAYITDASGRVIEPDCDGYIIMPYSDITVKVTASPIYYTVAFILGDTTLATRRVRYGELPIPPTVGAGMLSDKSQTFLGWSEELRPTYSDTVYIASVRSADTGIPDAAPPAPDTDTESDGGADAAIYILIVAAALAIVVAILVRRRLG